jgi:hypothetical protein
MTNELNECFQELAAEFNAIKDQVNGDAKFFNTFRISSYPSQGAMRYGTGFYQHTDICLKTDILAQYLRKYIKSFKSTNKIYDYIVRENLWDLTVRDFQTDLNSMPSITKNIVAGFLVRNFELNNNKLICTPDSINQSLAELNHFLSRNFIEFNTYMALYGPTGSLEEYFLDTNVTLRRADFKMARLFSLSYSDYDSHYIEMFEGDYVLAIRLRLPKSEFYNIHHHEQKAFDTWFHVPLLAKLGNIETGKRIRVSKDWPMVLTTPVHISWQMANSYNFSYRSKYVLNNDDVGTLEKISLNIKSVDFDKLDVRIKYSIERLRKAKACRDINDRVVELALALEYLINTSNYEVTMQLALKPVKLLHDKNEDTSLYRSLKAFYSLRSKVVHGNEKIDNDPRHLSTIDFMEVTVQQMVLRFMDLNKNYTFKQINEALEKALYISRPLHEILEMK